ncbi:MAG: hypothetical protein NT084_00640 [Bacteroidetes bacterium]|jgi:hypothetical protein|nr:hypothetical protein [Bacteroidota bacterium]
MKLFYNLILSTVFLFSIPFSASAQKDIPAVLDSVITLEKAPGKDTVKVGVYVTSIYSLGFAQNDFGIDYWVWYIYNDSTLTPLETTEIVNSESVSKDFASTEFKGNVYWATHKCSAMIKKNWDIGRFPLDGQTLDVLMEETVMDTSKLVYIADTANSKIDKSVQLSGWKISDFKLLPSNYTYNTTYGDPTLQGNSSYARLSISTKIERESKNIFLKLFLGLYVAFLIALSVFFLDGAEIGARVSLSVGALFASVGNKYIVDSSLPDHSSFTIVDKIHDVTFALILLSIVFSIIANGIDKKWDEKRTKKFDLACFVFLMLAYAFAHFIIIK